jgi:AsmA protein
VNAKIALRGPTVADLRAVAGVALPDTRPYSTSGQLIHHDKLWRYENFSGRIGQSDLGGTFSYDNPGDRHVIRGDLSSRLLRISDFGALVGASQKKIPPRGAGDPDDVLPDTPLPTASWQGLDADVRLRAGTLNAAKLPIHELDGHLVLNDRVMKLESLEAGVGGGTVSGSVTLDGQQKPARGKADIRLQHVYLSELLPAKDQAKVAETVKTGRMDGRVTLAGAGNSIEGLLGNADGRLSLVVNGGTISNFILEAVGIDLWEMLKFKVEGDKGVRIRCGVADFGVNNGVMQAEAVVLDTTDTKVTVTGDVNLGKETLDLTLHPQPKDMSLVSLRTPIHIRGSFANPKIVPDKTRLTARGLGAVALAVVNPLLALLPLVETGPGVDSDCGRLIAEARQSVDKPAAAAKK